MTKPKCKHCGKKRDNLQDAAKALLRHVEQIKAECDEQERYPAADNDWPRRQAYARVLGSLDHFGGRMKQHAARLCFVCYAVKHYDKPGEQPCAAEPS